MSLLGALLQSTSMQPEKMMIKIVKDKDCPSYCTRSWAGEFQIDGAAPGLVLPRTPTPVIGTDIRVEPCREAASARANCQASADPSAAGKWPDPSKERAKANNK